jgi:hypothetical protein
VNGTKHKTRAGGRECRCKQNTKTQAGGRVLIKQNTAAATATANPEQPSGSGSEAAVTAAVHRASCMGTDAHLMNSSGQQASGTKMSLTVKTRFTKRHGVHNPRRTNIIRRCSHHPRSMLMDRSQGKKSHPHGKSWKVCISNSISNTNELPAPS